MICEPNLDIPHVIRHDLIKKSYEFKNNGDRKLINSTYTKPNVSCEHKEYHILPLFNRQFDHLNNMLSLHSNEYLACRWNTFLENRIDNYIYIRLYMDYKKSLETKVVQRKLLNGKFYNMNNKIVPIPQPVANYKKKIKK